MGLLLDRSNYFNRFFDWLFVCQNFCAGPWRFFILVVMRKRNCHVSTGLWFPLKISRLWSSTVDGYACAFWGDLYTISCFTCILYTVYCILCIPYVITKFIYPWPYQTRSRNFRSLALNLAAYRIHKRYCNLRADVTIGQTFRGNGSKFNLVHILRLGRP